MAFITPGPLASSISGSIGGLTCAARAQGIVARARTTNTSPGSNRKTTQQTLLAAAAQAWATLTPAAQATWRSPDPRDPAPRAAFIAACGNSPIFPPTLPQMTAPSFRTVPVIPTIIRHAGRPTLTGFTPAPLLTERIRLRTYSAMTPASNTGFHFVRGDRTATGAQGLDFPTTQSLAFLTDASYMAGTYAFTANGNWTVEGYAAPTITNDYHTLWRFVTPNIAFTPWRASAGKMQLVYAGVLTNITAPPPDGQAHHYAVTSNAATSLAQAYYDGAPIGAPIPIAPAALTDLNLWGNQGTLTPRYIAGPLNWATIWDTPLDPAVIASRRIGDAFYPGQPGPGCQLLLKCQYGAAGVVLDYSGNGRNFAATAATSANSVFWQHLDNISSPPWADWSADIRVSNFTPPYPLPSPLSFRL